MGNRLLDGCTTGSSYVGGTILNGQAWWRTPVILALRRERRNSSSIKDRIKETSPQNHTKPKAKESEKRLQLNSPFD